MFLKLEQRFKNGQRKGVANIRTGIKQQVGVVTQTDDQGNVKGEAGLITKY